MLIVRSSRTAISSRYSEQRRAARAPLDGDAHGSIDARDKSDELLEPLDDELRELALELWDRVFVSMGHVQILARSGTASRSSQWRRRRLTRNRCVSARVESARGTGTLPRTQRLTLVRARIREQE